MNLAKFLINQERSIDSWGITRADGTGKEREDVELLDNHKVLYEKGSESQAS